MPACDGDGYLVVMNAWTPEIGKAMAEADGVDFSHRSSGPGYEGSNSLDDNAAVPATHVFASRVIYP